MPIFYDRIADQVEELLPEFYREDGPRFISFIKAYFEFLEKGQLIYKDAADIDYISLEDGTVAGEAFNADGQRGNLIQEPGTYAPSSVTSAKFNYEVDIDQYKLAPNAPELAKTSFEKDEYVVGSTSGAVGRIDVIGNSSNLYIEQFSEAQFDIDETITGKTSGMTAKVASFKASPLHAANNLLSYADVDKTSGDFIEYFRRDFMPFIDRDVVANKRLLQKHVKDLYLSKGTKESIEFLFRILYGDEGEAEVVYPGDNVIKPSESEFSQPTIMRLYSTKNVTDYKKGLIKKYTSGTLTDFAYINDASGMGGTNDSNDAYEIELVTPFTGTFDVGDEVTLSDRDGFRTDATAIVRGIMSDVDPDESSIYVGLEDGVRGDNEDIVRLESPTPIYILNEDGSNGIGYENGIPYGGAGYSETSDDGLIFEHALGGESYQAAPIELETGTGVGILLTEESVYDDDNNLTTDYALINEQTDLYFGMLRHGTRIISERPEEGWYGIELEGSSDVLLSETETPYQIDPLWTGTPSTRGMSGGLYEEQASLGSLYSESDTFNYNSPAGGTATQSINVIGGIGRGEITDIIIDDTGSGYAEGDSLVFVNADTEGSNAEAEVKTIRSFVQLEAGTLNEHTIYSFTATSGQTVFEGRDNAGLIMGFDPRKVKVYVAGTEKTRETQFTTDQSGGKITLTSGATANDLVEVYAAFQGIRLEDADNPNPNPKSGHPDNNYLTQETDGTISAIKITHPGENYKSLPQVFMGGYIYYNEMTTGTTFTVGEVLTSSNSKTVIVVNHDTEKKRVLVYKRPTDPAGSLTGTVTGAGGSAAVISQTTVTAGSGAKLWAYGDNIGAVKSLKMQDVGHGFVQGGIGNYKQHAVIKDISSGLTAATTVTAALTGATGTIDTINGNTNVLTLKNIKGLFNDGDYCTTSDNKNFVIGKINPCTARGKLSGTALYDGNYTNDTGFPSVDSMRIHDSHQYQDFSFKIKAEKPINEYRHLVKSLISPAGSILFGEVSIRQLIDGRAEMYNVNFSGDQTLPTRTFVPRLVIGSKIDLADIELEHATDIVGDLDEAVFGGGETGTITLEDDTGQLTTERFLCHTWPTATDHTTHTVIDQASGQRYSMMDIDRITSGPNVGQLVDPIVLSDKDLYQRTLEVEASIKGNRVTKELEIYPHYNQHKILYGTLNNALAVGTRVKGATSGAQGIVCAHDTTNKFIIVDRNSKDEGSQSSQFTGTEIIQNTAGSTNYFTATSIELHYTPEDISAKQDPTSITADTALISANQKISNGVEGGATTYTVGVSGFTGRGRILTANDPNETYDSEMRQRKVNIISSPLFTQGTTQRGRAYSAGVKQVRTLNTQNSRTLGSNTTANNSNGSAVRIDSAWNTISQAGVSFGHRPAGQKLFETTNFLSERIVSENQEPIVMELDHGQVLGEDFPQGGAVILEDDTKLIFEDATVVDETYYFVSEESSQLGSFNIISESNEKLIDETDSLPLIHEGALMVGQKDSNQTGPSIGDLADMMFTENYSMMKKIQLDGGSGISSGDDLLLETGEHCLLEAPSEGLRISDISNIYPNRFVSNLEREFGRKTNLTHSAVIQTG